MNIARVVLLNTSILTTHGVFAYHPLSIDEAREIAQLAYGSQTPGFTEDARQESFSGLLSAIGHQSTADMLSTLLGVPVAVNRIEYRQEDGDLAVVFKLRGRPPEGKILTKEEIEIIGYDFGLIAMTACGAQNARRERQQNPRAT